MKEESPLSLGSRSYQIKLTKDRACPTEPLRVDRPDTILRSRDSFSRLCAFIFDYVPSFLFMDA